MSYEQIFGLVVGGVAFLSALAWIFQKVRKAVRYALAIAAIVERELEHNHGSSMKDDVYGIAVQLGKAGRRLDDLEEKLDNHLRREQQ